MAGKRGQGEGSIYQRSDGRWTARMTLPDGKRRDFYAPTRREVVAKLHAAQENVKKALPVAGGRETVATFLERWLTDVAPTRVTATTLARYRLDVRLHILPALGRVRLAELTPADVQEMLSGLAAKGLSPASERHCRATLRVALAHAEKLGLVGRNVAKLVTTRRVRQKQVPALTPEAARGVLDAFRGHEYEGLVTLAIATGLRQGELLGLTWSDFDADRGTLRVERQSQRLAGTYELVDLKTERSRRTLALPAVAVAALRAQRTRQSEAKLKAGPAWVDTNRVFTTATGGAIHGSGVTHRFQAQLARTGLPRMTFHDLRHGAASLLLAQGASMRTVMEQLGHSQISLTMNTYAHVVPDLLRDAAGRMDRALGG